ncbi:MAG: thioredoxin domain-containing protein [Betaproteobacteria bacterium]|nr:thioredoxin domain-containing protein [Betaproteobacteria bacterium]
MPNRLIHETSPYLQQHAENPVDWYPWSEEALARSKKENKPILLSIGYSACHWCHVMAHESFEDPEVAEVMNRHFVNVKVDREERPDLDQIYQASHALLTQRSGGWPLTMFLTPDQVPFFGGTYFPRTSRFGLPGFKGLLQQIADAYRTRSQDIAEQNDAVLAALGRMGPQSSGEAVELGDRPLRGAITEFKGSFDMVHGGLGQAPKFPHPAELELCLRRYAATGNGDALHMALHTLKKMAEGGIYDHLGGGFCRYSVDQTWTIPHFEKMLYDNGPLLRLYADAWALTGDKSFATVAEETAAWAIGEMQSPAGGYYSSLDADSEHEEGKFYVWDPSEVRALLTPEEFAVAAPHYGLDQPPNFENRHWHLRIVQPLAGVAPKLGVAPTECERLLISARAKLFATRGSRVRPGRDEKILTSWNALMIRGMARAGRALGRPEWIDSALGAADFLRENLWKDRVLLATCRDGRAHLNAYLDDHAFLLNGLLELLQARFRAVDLEFALGLADALLARFDDRDRGGFFFTSHDHEPLIHRDKPGYDNATPSGNGAVALGLLRLGHVLGESRYLEAAERSLRLFYPAMERQPGAFATLSMALEEALSPPRTVVIRGPDHGCREWQATLDRLYLPNTLIFNLGTQTGLPSALEKPGSNSVNAWVCEGVNCLPAIGDLERLVAVCKSGKTI